MSDTERDDIRGALHRLSKSQMRQVLDNLARLHPKAVMTAISQLHEQDDASSVMTEHMSNVTLKQEDEDVPPLLLRELSRTTSSGDLPPPSSYALSSPDNHANPRKIFTRSDPSIGDIKPILADRAISNDGKAKANDGFCYLIYDPDSSGKLMLNYSHVTLDNAIGVFTPGEGKSFSPFKFTQNLGRSELIGNCASGVNGRKNYYSGLCQFVRAAKMLDGNLTLLPSKNTQGLPIDVFFYTGVHRVGEETVQLQDDVPYHVSSSIVAVACLPKHAQFYSDVTVDLNKWMTEASAVGAASRL